MSDAGNRLMFYAMLGASLPGRTCDECNGTGFSVQGWTDKNGEPEDQYGPCACGGAE